MQTAQTYRYRLDGSNHEPKKKIDCPYCGGKKTFTRYKDYETGQYLDNSVGVCDRSNKCSAHIKPKEWFTHHPEAIQAQKKEGILIQPINHKPVHIPTEVLKSTLNQYEANSFIKALLNYFPAKKIEKAISEYFLGTINSPLSENNSQSVVFWFIDRSNNIRAGQVKQFDENCKTIALELEDRSIKAFWIHRILRKYYLKQSNKLPDWLTAYEETEKVTCFFGEHLLTKYRNKPVAVTEAPKSAIIGSMMYDSFIWVATSSLSYLTKERCKALQGRKVVLFPDCGIPNKRTGLTCLEQWKDRVNEFESIADFSFSTLLEDHATPQQKESGFDIADLILQELKNKKHIIGKEDISDIRCSKLDSWGPLNLYTIWLKDGKIVDTVSDETGAPITDVKLLKPLAEFYKLNLIPAVIDGKEALINIANN